MPEVQVSGAAEGGEAEADATGPALAGAGGERRPGRHGATVCPTPSATAPPCRYARHAAMEHIEAVIISLLVAVAFLSAIATRIGIPYPILLVVGGLGLGFVPGIPDVRLEPDLVLVVFLPPLLYSAAFFANLRELRADARTITLTSTVLVAFTAAAVAVAAHALVDGPAVGGGVRARRDRRPDRPRRRDPDPAALRRPPAARQHDRGRGADQRRLGARALQDLGRRDRRRARSRSRTPACVRRERRRAAWRSGSSSRS